eukprot:Hpha_TRINITY_DN16464_c2_g11::TRINITY_DN16464_c2_g11_i1::g.162131::m.162131
MRSVTSAHSHASRGSIASSQARRWPFAYGAPKPEQSEGRGEGTHSCRTWLALYKCLLGTAVLGMPHAIEKTGLVLFPILLFGCAFMAFAGCRYILRTLDIVREPDANAISLGRMSAGLYGELLALAVVALDSWGATVAFIRTGGEVVQSLLTEPSVLDKGHWYTDMGPICLSLSLVVFPLLLYGGTGSGMAWVNIIGILALMGLTVALLVDLVQHGQSLEGQTLATFDWGTFSTIPVIAFAYDGAQVNQFPFHREWPAAEGEGAGKTVGQRLGKVTLASCMSSATTYYAVAMLAYCVHLSDTKSDIMDNLDNHHVVYVIIKIAFVASMMLTVPVTVFESVAVVQEYAFREDEERRESKFIDAFLKFLLLLSAAIVAAFVPSMYAAFGYVGATTATLWVAVLPSMFFLGAVRKFYPSRDEEEPAAEAEEGDPPGKQVLPEQIVALLAGREEDAQDGRAGLPPPPSRCEVWGAKIMFVGGLIAMVFFVTVTAIG